MSYQSQKRARVEKVVVEVVPQKRELGRLNSEIENAEARLRQLKDEIAANEALAADIIQRAEQYAKDYVKKALVPVHEGRLALAEDRQAWGAKHDSLMADLDAKEKLIKAGTQRNIKAALELAHERDELKKVKEFLNERNEALIGDQEELQRWHDSLDIREDEYTTDRTGLAEWEHELDIQHHNQASSQRVLDDAWETHTHRCEALDEREEQIEADQEALNQATLEAQKEWDAALGEREEAEQALRDLQPRLEEQRAEAANYGMQRRELDDREQLMEMAERDERTRRRVLVRDEEDLKVRIDEYEKRQRGVK